jgi:Xaa-Pro aminopeptidase
MAESSVDLLSTDALDRKIEPGFVDLDLGFNYRRYASDINRGIFLGRRPNKNDEKLYACRLGVSELMDQMIKPGVCMDDVLAETSAYAQKCGCLMQKRLNGMLFAGHGIGLEPYQQPGIVPSAVQPAFQNKEGKVLFQPGMMFTFEMAIELPGANCPFFNIEDDVVVTDTGVENMSSMLSREIRVKTGGNAAAI